MSGGLSRSQANYVSLYPVLGIMEQSSSESSRLIVRMGSKTQQAKHLFPVYSFLMRVAARSLCNMPQAGCATGVPAAQWLKRPCISVQFPALPETCLQADVSEANQQTFIVAAMNLHLLVVKSIQAKLA